MKISVDHSHRYSYAVVKLQNVTPIDASYTIKISKKYFTPDAYHCYLNCSKDLVERGQGVDSRVKIDV